MLTLEMVPFEIVKRVLAEIIRDEGRIEEVQKTILALGSRRYGRASVDIASEVSSMDNLARLHALRDRLLDATSWQDLLNPQAQ
jgi:hypothetical protein